MKILITGAGGYVGKRLIYVLAEAGHELLVLVRSKKRFHLPEPLAGKVTVVEANLLDPESLSSLPETIDAAYYLVHSMGQSAKGFAAAELICAKNFSAYIERTCCQQVLYLSGLCRQGEKEFSEHMRSRLAVEKVLAEVKGVKLTVFRAGIIIGSGSASFEIIRDLVEKLPVMIAPRWVSSLCQPIAISDVLYYLSQALLNPLCLGKTFEIGGPDILSYKEILLRFAKVRGLKRWILSVPVLTPYLSSLWLFFITSTNFSLARALVNSLKVDAICQEHEIDKAIPRQCLSFEDAVKRAFEKIAQNEVISSWKTAMVLSELSPMLDSYIEVPSQGCHKMSCSYQEKIPKEQVTNKLWQIGGEHGWYYMNWAWKLRGYLDQFFGGVGLRRGRPHPTELYRGDTLDFWRVLKADKEQGSLLLYTEMRVPGEAWLEWQIQDKEGECVVTQVATFRPRGLWGRFYWYLLFPIHKFLFPGLCKSLFR